LSSLKYFRRFSRRDRSCPSSWTPGWRSADTPRHR